MSGMNTILRTMKRPTRNLAGTKTIEQKSYIRDYCSDHPLEDYLAAVANLFVSLPIVTNNRPPPR
jgi:hypothetical protein